MVDSSSIITASLSVFLTIGLGVLVRHWGWLKQEADQSITRLIVNVLIPALILDKILDNPAMERIDNLLLAPAVGFGTVAFGFLIAMLTMKIFPAAKGAEARTFSVSTGIYNYGYIPLPIIMALFDRETVGVLFLHNLGVETAMWTLGLLLLSGGSVHGGWKKMINGPLLAVIVGVLFTRIHWVQYIPDPGLMAIRSVGACAIPVALLMIGAIFRDLISPGLFAEGKRAMIMGVMLRMAILPLAMLATMLVLPVSLELKQVMVVQAAMPCALFPVILARYYGGDAPTAVRLAVVTLLISIVTTPLWIAVGLKWLG